ncbi:hypothetical protein DFS34DRAFT_295587 [Phlyctochytrium arcticum]|nr:hypothetical protein DFS34DRAFT_295587 [Phlyctochytrium arcticum]
MAATSASQLGLRRRGAAKIPFFILALCVPLLLGLIIGSSPTVVDASCACHTDAPTTISGYLDQDACPPMSTRVSCNADVAIYMSSTVMNLPKKNNEVDRPILQQGVEIYEDQLRELFSPAESARTNRTRMRTFWDTETIDSPVWNRRKSC